MNNTLSAAVDAPEMFSQLGHITRQLHDSLEQLGVMPKLQSATEGLPDARSRLEYIAEKTGQAAERVLNLVDSAKAHRTALADALGRVAASPCPACGMGNTAIGEANQHLQHIDTMLTEIMLAQDFHDLTGQVVRRVVALASDLEDSLVKVLLKAAPSVPTPKPESSKLQGPVVGPNGRGEVASNQSEVDDLLASLGF